MCVVHDIYHTPRAGMPGHQIVLRDIYLGVHLLRDVHMILGLVREYSASPHGIYMYVWCDGLPINSSRVPFRTPGDPHAAVLVPQNSACH